MDPQIVGQTVFRTATASEDLYIGFWMPRAGDEANYGISVTNFSGGTETEFNLEVQTKNAEEADSAAVQIGSDIAIDGNGVKRATISGAKEWVRYLIKSSSSTNVESMHFTLLPPQWVPN